MENILIFALTFSVYGGLLFLYYHNKSPITITKKLAVLALLCLPVNINGRVFTVIGNAVGEKGVYSLCSLYQKSDGDALSIIGLAGYQKAGRDAVTFLGLAGYQKAGRDAWTVIGLAGYQKAGRDAGTFLGLAGYQKAGLDAVTIIGLAGYQKAGLDAVTIIGLAGYQKVDDGKVSAERSFGAFAPLKLPTEEAGRKK